MSQAILRTLAGRAATRAMMARLQRAPRRPGTRAVAKWERADVARPDRHPARHPGSADVGLGAFQHERRDVHRRDLRAEAPGDLHRGGGYPAANVEDRRAAVIRARVSSACVDAGRPGV